MKTRFPLTVNLKRGINGTLSHRDATETKLLPSKWLPAKTGRCYTNVCRCKLKVRPRAGISSQFICIFTALYYYLKPPVQTFNQCDNHIISTERETQSEIRTFSQLCKFWTFVTDCLLTKSVSRTVLRMYVDVFHPRREMCILHSAFSDPHVFRLVRKTAQSDC